MPRLLAFWLRVLGCYGQAMILMIICWTLIVYFNQEYRSPSYQQSFSKCLRWASWIAPVNGGGPFVPVFFSPIAPDDSGFWLFPWEGLGIYIVFAAVAYIHGVKVLVA